MQTLFIRLIFYLKLGRSMIQRIWVVMVIKFESLSLLMNSNLEINN